MYTCINFSRNLLYSSTHLLDKWSPFYVQVSCYLNFLLPLLICTFRLNILIYRYLIIFLLLRILGNHCRYTGLRLLQSVNCFKAFIWLSSRLCTRTTLTCNLGGRTLPLYLSSKRWYRNPNAYWNKKKCTRKSKMHLRNRKY